VIITIDGPAGSGKTSTARAVADRLGFLYLDTGAMYRAVALAFARGEHEATLEAARDVVAGLELDVRHDPDGGMRVWLNGEEVTQAIRAPEVGERASRVSALPPVRHKLVAEQRRLGRARAEERGGVVLDGRDTGTVVFPDAALKVFMTADPEERARRRQAQQAERGHEQPLEDILDEIRERDERDMTRAVGPLRKADDAIVLDTTERDFDEQVRFIAHLARERMKG
jgi:cytidylate kinase